MGFNLSSYITAEHALNQGSWDVCGWGIAGPSSAIERPEYSNFDVHCRNPPLAPVELLMREVWAVPQHLALRNSVVEVQEVSTVLPFPHADHVPY